MVYCEFVGHPLTPPSKCCPLDALGDIDWIDLHLGLMKFLKGLEEDRGGGGSRGGWNGRRGPTHCYN
jgi:hypothetical protein